LAIKKFISKEEFILKKVHERNFEVIYTTLLKEDAFGIYLNITWKTEALVKKVVHELYDSNYKVDCSYNNDNQRFYIRVDNNIIINGKFIGCDYLSKESIFLMDKFMEENGVTENDLLEAYSTYPTLSKEPEPYMMKYKCSLSLSLADDVSDEYYEIAEKILLSIVPKKVA
jgi:hypothetical protein